MALIVLPDFDFAGFYYADIIEALLEYQRKNVPEISNENPFEPSVQNLRAYALTCHLNNVLLDSTAQEVYPGPARLRASVVRLLALMGFAPNADIPAVSEVRMQLTSGFTISTLIVPDNALFGTRRRAETPVTEFEADESVTVNPTDELDGAWLYNNNTEVWTDQTAEVNADSDTIEYAPIAERHLYLAHDSAMTDTVEFTGIGTPIDFGDDQDTDNPISFHLQFFDGELQDTAPDSPIPALGAGGIRFNINGLVGSLPKTGTHVHVFVNATGATQRLAVNWDDATGKNYITTTGFLGQTSVSTTAADYTVGSYWHDVTIDSDGTSAAPPVTGETFDTGNGSDVTFGPNTLVRWPLEPDTIITWTYLSGATPRTASYDLSDGSIGGDAALGTTVDASTGASTLVATNAPDAGDFDVAYSRKAQRLRQDGEIAYKVPKTIDDDWTKSELPDDLVSTTGPTTEGYWLRFIVCAVGAGAVQSLVFDRVNWDQGGLFIAVDVTQGRTVSNEAAGSGDGSPDQTFTLDETEVIDGSVLFFISGAAWTQVDSFASSSEVSEHYRVTIDDDGEATVLTGDGINGAVVPVGSANATAEYRVGGESDGNVGADQISVNLGGISRVRNITNPRSAFGWTQREGADEVSLEKLKRDGIASLRTLDRAVSPADIEHLTGRFKGANSSRPFSRARAVENGFGLKTVKNIVVGTGGVSTTAATRAALDLFFNGDLASGGVNRGVLIANQEVTSVDFTPKAISVTAVVTGGSVANAKAALLAALQPEARLDDGSDWRWRFGQTITRSALIGIIWGGDRANTDVDLSVPASDTPLAGDELPDIDLGTLLITAG